MLQKSSMDKTIEIFFVYPDKDHYLMDISRKAGIAHTSVKKNLDKLVKLGLLKILIENRGNRKYPIYKANFESKLFREQKKIYNINALLESGVVEFLNDSLMPRCIVLFGSYQRGEDSLDSDIDIFVECEKEELDIKKFEKKLNRKIELHFKEKFSLYPKELKNNIINGIVLKGFLEGC